MVGSGATDPGPDSIRSAAELGEWLTAARSRAALTVRDLAKRSGLPHSTVGGYLTGRHVPPASRPEVLFALLSALEVEVDDADAWRQMLWRLTQARRPRGTDESGPYQGLLPFDEHTARYFFGRESEVRELRSMVDAALTAAGTSSATPVVVVVGASGSGKSSLVRAGLVPALGDSWHVETIRPGTSPVETFGAVSSGMQQRSSGHGLVVLDQLEELWTLNDERNAEAALEALLVPALTDTVVVATLRADFYGSATRIPALARALRKRQVVVSPLTDENLARTVTGPADVAGVEIAPGLVDRIVADARSHANDDRSAASLPHLSHCLRQMWERRERNTLTHALYEQVGGISGALSSTAEGIFTSLSVPDRAVARSLLLRLVVVEEGMPPIAGELPVDAVSGEPERHIAHRLADERLIVLDEDSVRLSHEALLTAWPRMAGWIDEDREVLKTSRLVEREAVEWRAGGEDADLLLRGSRLEAATELDREKSLLSPLGRQFVAVGLHVAEAERRRTERHDRRQRRLLVATSVFSAVALVACIGLVATALGLRKARDEARSRQLAAQARELVGVDPVISEQLALAAYAAADTVESRSALLDAAGRPATVNLNGPTGVQFVAAAPGAHLMATGGESKDVILYDTSTTVPQRIASVPAPLGDAKGAALFAIALSEDGRWLAAAGTAGILRIWSLSNPSAPQVVADSLDVGGTVNDIVFDLASSTVFAGSSSAGVRGWRLGDNLTEVPPITGQSGAVSALALLGPGLIAVGTDTGQLSVWRTGQPTAPIAARSVGERQITGIALSSGRLAVSSRAARAYLVPWNAGSSTLGEPQEVGSFTNWVNDAAASPGTDLTVFGSSDKVVAVVDGAGVVRERIPVADNVTSVAFVSPRRIAIGVVNGQTIVRDLPPYAGNGTFGSVYATGWAKDNVAVLAAVGADGHHDLSLWDVSDPARPAQLSRITKGSADGRSFGPGGISPDGRVAVDSTDAGWLDAWDLSDPRHPAERFSMPLADTSIEAVRFVNDDTFLTPSDDGHVRVMHLPATGRATVAFDLGGASGNLLMASATPDLKVVAAGSTNGTVYVWEPAGGLAPVAQISVPGYVYAVALTPDGSQLAVSGTDRKVRVYDMSRPAEPRLLSTIPGGTGTTFTLDYDPTGTRLLATINDGSLVVYRRDGTTYERYLQFDRGTPLYYGTWSPDGSHVLAGGSAGYARLVPTVMSQAEPQLCATIGQWLTSERWSASLPVDDITDPCH